MQRRQSRRATKAPQRLGFDEEPERKVPSRPIAFRKRTKIVKVKPKAKPRAAPKPKAPVRIIRRRPRVEPVIQRQKFKIFPLTFPPIGPGTNLQEWENFVVGSAEEASGNIEDFPPVQKKKFKAIIKKFIQRADAKLDKVRAQRKRKEEELKVSIPKRKRKPKPPKPPRIFKSPQPPKPPRIFKSPQPPQPPRIFKSPPKIAKKPRRRIVPQLIAPKAKRRIIPQLIKPKPKAPRKKKVRKFRIPIKLPKITGKTDLDKVLQNLRSTRVELEKRLQAFPDAKNRQQERQRVTTLIGIAEGRVVEERSKRQKAEDKRFEIRLKADKRKTEAKQKAFAKEKQRLAEKEKKTIAAAPKKRRKPAAPQKRLTQLQFQLKGKRKGQLTKRILRIEKQRLVAERARKGVGKLGAKEVPAGRGKGKGRARLVPEQELTRIRSIPNRELILAKEEEAKEFFQKKLQKEVRRKRAAVRKTRGIPTAKQKATARFQKKSIARAEAIKGPRRQERLRETARTLWSRGMIIDFIKRRKELNLEELEEALDMAGMPKKQIQDQATFISDLWEKLQPKEIVAREGLEP